MKKALIVLFVIIAALIVGLTSENQSFFWVDQILRETTNPFRIVLCVTEDLRTSMAVNFELSEDVPGFVEYRLLGENAFIRCETDEKTVSVGMTPVFFREGDLVGLLPGMVYEYRVGGGDKISDIYSFKTMEADPSCVSFLV